MSDVGNNITMAIFSQEVDKSFDDQELDLFIPFNAPFELLPQKNCLDIINVMVFLNVENKSKIIIQQVLQTT